MHHDASGNKGNIDIEHKCSYIIKENKSAQRCNLVFKSGYELLAHKKQTGHIRGEKRKIVNIAST